LKAKIHVTLKDGVLDPQGKAVGHALAALGFGGIGEVRQGKYIEIDLADGDAAGAEADVRSRVEDMCRKLLANTVIENYEIEIER
jgi:phosphoribosylformylglycinamidine synthase PurS subunit